MRDNLKDTVLRRHRKEYTLYASHWPCTEKFAIAGMLTAEIQ